MRNHRLKSITLVPVHEEGTDLLFTGSVWGYIDVRKINNLDNLLHPTRELSLEGQEQPQVSYQQGESPYTIVLPFNVRY